MVRIAVVGPECSGKSTLVQELMLHYRSGMVSEVAREYLDALDRPYTEEDLLEIARAQWDLNGQGERWAAEHEAALQHPDLPRTGKPKKPLFLDTDIVNILIWSREKFGRVHPELERMARQDRYTYRFLCRPDIPWVADPQRENPHDRDRLFAVWERTLTELGHPYTIIEGPRAVRSRKATAMVDVLLQGHPTS
jgi:nicotinamide riboside kinase